MSLLIGFQAGNLQPPFLIVGKCFLFLQQLHLLEQQLVRVQVSPWCPQV